MAGNLRSAKECWVLLVWISRHDNMPTQKIRALARTWKSPALVNPEVSEAIAAVRVDLRIKGCVMKTDN